MTRLVQLQLAAVEDDDVGAGLAQGVGVAASGHPDHEPEAAAVAGLHSGNGVLDDGRPLGIVSRADLLEALVR